MSARRKVDSVKGSSLCL